MNTDVSDPIEARVRATLHAVAATTPVTGGDLAATSAASRSSRRPLLAGLAAAAAVAVVVAAAAVASRDGSDGVRLQIPATTPDGAAPAFDRATAAPVFSAAGSPDEVAEAYLRSRFPDYPSPEVGAQPAVVEGATATVEWATGSEQDFLATGFLHLRRSGERWAVIEATTNGVDLDGVRYDGERVAGVVRSTNQDSLFADVLDWRGEPVHRSPNPDGHEGAAYRFGTAAGPGTGELEIDVAHRGAPTVLRVNLVGGTILSIAERRYEPEPLRAHRDQATCERELTTVEKEPTPDVVFRRCAEALEGTVLAEGDASDRRWQLVATDEPTGHWVTLRARDLIGTFRFQPGGDTPGDARVTPFRQAGPCCAAGDDIAVVAATHPDVASVRIRIGDDELESITVADPATPSVRYAVLMVPSAIARAGDAAISFRLRDGAVVEHPEPLGLAVLGG